MSKRSGTIAAAIVAFVLGAFAVQLLPNAIAQDKQPKAPTWHHGLGLKVRKGDEADFNKDTKKIGLEVYRDENNGNWIYITENGSIAVVPGK